MLNFLERDEHLSLLSLQYISYLLVKKKKEKNMTQYIVVSKRESLRCELHTGDVKIKLVWKSKYMSSVMKVDGKYNTEIRSCIAITEDVFQKLKLM